MNVHAQVLQKHEARIMRSDPSILKRIIESYKLILGFYGIELVDLETGKLRRAENYADRYKNLNAKPHNYLRITRILKFLGGNRSLSLI